jgi:flagellar biosynthesis chaperone FliJ
MIYKVDKKEVRPRRLKKGLLAWILKWARGEGGVKEDVREKAKKRLAEVTRQLNVIRWKISQCQDSLDAIGRSKQEYEQVYEDALKAMDVAWQNYGSLRPQWEAEIDTFEKAVASLLTIQNELEQYQALIGVSNV